MAAGTGWSRRSFLLGSACSAVGFTAVAGSGDARRSSDRGSGLPSPTTTNLIPAGGSRPLSYWCTWQAQLDAAEAGGSSTDYLTQNATRALNERHLFQTPGWSRYFAPVRRDLLLLADLGWDVPADAVFPESEAGPLGSCVLDERKFPSFTGTPVERLKKLVKRVEADGWGGLGVWLPAQPFGARVSNELQGEPLAAALRASVQILREAGVSYLKFDYGARAESVEFRRLLSDIIAAQAPGLLVEHASPSGALNDFAAGPGDRTVVHKTGRYRPWGDGAILRRAAGMLEFSDVLRTYDTLELFGVSSRLDRTAELLSAARGLRKSAILNNEDSLYLAAALGCAVGTLRYPHPKDQRPRMREVVRAVRWQRIAPPFPAHVGRLEVDDRVLTDSFDYTAQTAEFWMSSIVGQHVIQGAPARIARGMDLPEVISDTEPPFVAASRHPNGAVAVAALPRTNPQAGSYQPLADVSLRIEGDAPIGLFGRFRSVRLELGAPLRQRRVLAQDLATDRAYDATSMIAAEGTSITVPGALIERLSAFGTPKQDYSEPAIVLRCVSLKP